MHNKITNLSVDLLQTGVELDQMGEKFRAALYWYAFRVLEFIDTALWRCKNVTFHTDK